MAEEVDVEGLSELGRAAVWYVEHNFGVFPLVPHGKKPNCPHGLNDWTDNPANVVDWWRKHPNDNVGIACGTPSGGLLVLDFDVDEEKDKDGLATLYEWEKAHGELPETAVAITGRGGMHYLYRTDRTNIHPSVNTDLSVDIRSDGSYIVAPPSIHENGRKYEWQDSPKDTAIATANGAVYDFLDFIQRNGGHDEIKKENGKFRLPDVIKEGTRDDTLFKYASHLRGVGRSDEEIMNAVAGVNAMRCRPPMDPSDVERIVRSACRYERREGDVSDREVGKLGSSGPINIRGPRGGLLTNKVAQLIMHRNHARHIDGAPAVWTGDHWEFGKRAIGRVTLSIADDAKQQDRNEVFSYIQTMAPQTDSQTSFDGRYYVQFANCTYDVMADEVVEPRPEMYIIGKLPVELNMDVGPNLADEFLSSVAGGDEKVKTALCEVIGTCMCSRRAMDKAVFLVGRASGSEGKASNGKSTFIRFVRSILGSSNTSSLDIATMGQRFGAGGIVGKLANLGDDIPNSFLTGENMAVFKKVVTGETMNTDVKNGDRYDFTPSATMVFSMNEVPRIADSTGGTLRRLYFVPFRARFAPGTPGYDRDMAHKLMKPEVLQRGALLGLMALGDLIRRGEPTHIADMDEEVAEVKRDNDNVARWMYDMDINADDIDGEPLSDVYRRYHNWCEEAGERNPVGRNFFIKRINDAGRFGARTAFTGFGHEGKKSYRCIFFK